MGGGFSVSVLLSLLGRKRGVIAASLVAALDTSLVARLRGLRYRYMGCVARPLGRGIE